jgi:hypothetical protein
MEFWKNKRIPSQLEFNIDDELNINFLFNYLKISANLMNISFINYEFKFKDQLKKVFDDINNNIDNSLITEPEILYKKLLIEIIQLNIILFC